MSTTAAPTASAYDDSGEATSFGTTGTIESCTMSELIARSSALQLERDSAWRKCWDLQQKNLALERRLKATQERLEAVSAYNDDEAHWYIRRLASDLIRFLEETQEEAKVRRKFWLAEWTKTAPMLRDLDWAVDFLRTTLYQQRHRNPSLNAGNWEGFFVNLNLKKPVFDKSSDSGVVDLVWTVLKTFKNHDGFTLAHPC